MQGKESISHTPKIYKPPFAQLHTARLRAGLNLQEPLPPLLLEHLPAYYLKTR